MSNRLLIGTSNGTILQRSLSDSSVLETFSADASSSQTVDTVTVDDYGTIWASSGLHPSLL